MRRPEYTPSFSEQDIIAAQEICRKRNAPYVQVQRASLALFLHEHPNSYSVEAARALRLHEQTVRKWRKRWAEQGFSIQDEPRSGRPRRFSP